MKNIFKVFLIGCLVIAGTSSCEDSTLPIDELYENVDTSAAFIRTLVEPSTAPHNLTPGDNFPDVVEAVIEIQEGNGTIQPDFKEVRVYASLYEDQDQTIPLTDSQGNDIAEVQLETFPASEFSPSEVNNLPSIGLTVPTQTIVDNNPDANFSFPTYIYLRLELEMNDGRVFTDTNVGPTVESGNYFQSPFFYNIIFLNN